MECPSSRRRFKGVRRRRWGKWGAEIRVPKSRKKIWLGSFGTPDEAARAYDAALYCLRGSHGHFNFSQSLSRFKSLTFTPLPPSCKEIKTFAVAYALERAALTQNRAKESPSSSNTENENRMPGLQFLW